MYAIQILKITIINFDISLLVNNEVQFSQSFKTKNFNMLGRVVLDTDLAGYPAK